MNEPGKKYNDEDNMLVNDLRSIVSKARSKAFAAVNYSLVERNWRRTLLLTSQMLWPVRFPVCLYCPVQATPLSRLQFVYVV